MSSDQESIHLLERWKAGDEEAADEIFQRYLTRLVGLARNRLSDRMRRRVDAEDVVQSAFRSFFRHAKGGRYELGRSGDLWRLLAAITVNKTLGQVEFHQAAKRAINHEEAMPDSGASSWLPPAAITHQPTVEESLALADELESFMRTLEPIERQVLELRLQDRNTGDIADEIERSTRTVRRVLDRLKSALSERFEQLAAHGSDDLQAS